MCTHQEPLTHDGIAFETDNRGIWPLDVFTDELDATPIEDIRIANFGPHS